MGRSPERSSCKHLRTKCFHEVSSASSHAYSLKLQYGKVRPLPFLIEMDVRLVRAPEITLMERAMPVQIREVSSTAHRKLAVFNGFLRRSIKETGSGKYQYKLTFTIRDFAGHLARAQNDGQDGQFARGMDDFRPNGGPCACKTAYKNDGGGEVDNNIVALLPYRNVIGIKGFRIGPYHCLGL